LNGPHDASREQVHVRQQRSDGSSRRQSAADAEWISAIVEQYEVRLTQYAARLLRDADRARDVVQDTFMKLWRVDRSEVEAHLSQWLFRVCRNRALDVAKKEVRMRPMDDNHMQVLPAPSTTERASASESSGEDASVLAALDELPDKQQEVIRLKFQAGLSYKEIAEVMDLTANHVGVLIHTAIKAIREKLNAASAVPQTDACPPSRANASATRLTP
jgi:RNA polymerase sigma factor (sigma-70 family)